MDASTSRTLMTGAGRSGALPQSISQGVGRIADAARQLHRQMLRADRDPARGARNSGAGPATAPGTASLNPGNQTAASQGHRDGWAGARAAELADAAVGSPDLNTTSWIEYLLAGPVRPVDLGLSVLGPAAGILGTMWLEDRASFNQVGLGMWRLRRLHEDLRDRLSLDAGQLPVTGHTRTILLASAPGEQHSFGLSLVAGLFESRRWFAEVLSGDDGRSLLAEVAARPVDVAGLTISRADLAPQLAALIAQIRLVSINPSIRIVIGGGLLGQEMDCELLRLQLGADAALADARDAVEHVERLLPPCDGELVMMRGGAA
jgi:MerR family transcriptional regulator, light-induced transcriptional regulator